MWFSGDGTGKKNLPKDAAQCHHPFSNTVWCGSQVMELEKKILPKDAVQCHHPFSSTVRSCAQMMEQKKKMQTHHPKDTVHCHHSTASKNT